MTITAPPPGPALVAVAHGSRDPRALASATALLDRVRALRPGLDVRLGHIELNEPLLGAVLAALPAGAAVLVPLLLGRGHHVGHDLPAALAGGPAPARRRRRPARPAPAARPRAARPAGRGGLGPARPGRRARRGRLARPRRSPATPCAPPPYSAPGSAGARPARLRLAAAPTVPDAVAALAARGARRIAVASCFAAPGRFATQAAAAAPWLVSAPLGAHPAMAELVLRRYDRPRSPGAVPVAAAADGRRRSRPSARPDTVVAYGRKPAGAVHPPPTRNAMCPSPTSGPAVPPSSATGRGCCTPRRCAGWPARRRSSTPARAAPPAPTPARAPGSPTRWSARRSAGSWAPRWAATPTWWRPPAWPTTSGHPPFGHNGELVLAEFAEDCGGFEGNAQSLRLLTRIEPKRFADAPRPAPPAGRHALVSVGLNLTRAALDAATKYPWPRGGRPADPGSRKFGVYEDDLPVFGWLRAGRPRGPHLLRGAGHGLGRRRRVLRARRRGRPPGRAHRPRARCAPSPSAPTSSAARVGRYAPPDTDPAELAEALDRLLGPAVVAAAATTDRPWPRPG